MIRSDLDQIKGIGPKTKEILLKHFDSVEKIKVASAEELENLVGAAKSSILTEYFRKRLVSTWNNLNKIKLSNSLCDVYGLHIIS